MGSDDTSTRHRGCIPIIDHHQLLLLLLLTILVRDLAVDTFIRHHSRRVIDLTAGDWTRLPIHFLTLTLSFPTLTLAHHGKLPASSYAVH